MGALVALLLMFAAAAQAQELKIGYVNTDSVFASLPQTKVQQRELESYGKQLQARLQQLQQALQQKYQDAVQRVQAGLVTPAEQKQLEQELQKMQEDLQKEQAAAEVNLSRKEQMLLQPLYEQIRKTIGEMAKAEGFTYVLSENMLVYGSPVHDITQKVIDKIKGS
jgi:outer membrane protein